MKNLIDYAYQDNGTDFRKELYSAIHDKVAAHIESKKQEIASGYMGKQEESVEELDENSTEKFAHYTGSKAKGYTVRVTDSMQPTGGLVVPVNSKSHAKQVAKDHGAKPWNF